VSCQPTTRRPVVEGRKRWPPAEREEEKVAGTRGDEGAAEEEGPTIEAAMLEAGGEEEEVAAASPAPPCHGAPPPPRSELPHHRSWVLRERRGAEEEEGVAEEEGVVASGEVATGGLRLRAWSLRIGGGDWEAGGDLGWEWVRVRLVWLIAFIHGPDGPVGLLGYRASPWATSGRPDSCRAGLSLWIEIAAQHSPTSCSQPRPEIIVLGSCSCRAKFSCFGPAHGPRAFWPTISMLVNCFKETLKHLLGSNLKRQL
jgi:hypothetical protein